MDIKPALLIFAAGQGSRFGGAKQTDKVGPNGERIIDYSVYDALNAGFEKVVYVINQENKEYFKSQIIKRLPYHVKSDFVIQDIKGNKNNPLQDTARIKPWGTGHALLSAAGKIKGPFLVINADDFYGRRSYHLAYDFLADPMRGVDNYAMIAYSLKNTLPDAGSVSRAICKTDSKGKLKQIIERADIKRIGSEVFATNENKNPLKLRGDELTSMNMFAFSDSIFKKVEDKFMKFLSKHKSDKNAEFYLPKAIQDLLTDSECEVDVIKTDEDWFGMTYKKDREFVRRKIAHLINSGLYPEKLW